MLLTYQYITNRLIRADIQVNYLIGYGGSNCSWAQGKDMRPLLPAVSEVQKAILPFHLYRGLVIRLNVDGSSHAFPKHPALTEQPPPTTQWAGSKLTTEKVAVHLRELQTTS